MNKAMFKERNQKIFEEYISKVNNRDKLSVKYKVDYSVITKILRQHGIKDFWDSQRVPSEIKTNIIKDYKANKISRLELVKKYNKDIKFIDNLLRRNNIKIWDIMKKNRPKRKFKKESKYLNYRKEWYNSIFSAYNDRVRDENKNDI